MKATELRQIQMLQKCAVFGNYSWCFILYWWQPFPATWNYSFLGNSWNTWHRFFSWKL